MAYCSLLKYILNPEDVLVVYSSHKIYWTHSLGALMLGWTGS